MIRPPVVLSLMLTGPALALELPAGAVMTGEDNDRRGSLAVATGPPFVDGTVPTRSLDGAVIRQAWRLPGTGLTTAQLMAFLRTQLGEDDWRIEFDCQEVTCGGFDFRFATLVFGEPVMHVDLGDYRYLMASKGGDSHIALLVSRSPPGAGYVQVLRVGGPAEEAQPVTTASDMNGTAPPAITFPTAGDGGGRPAAIGAQMEQVGYAVLSDLVFQTGSSALGEADFPPSLTELAGYLAANPTKRVTLVGHTDAVGSLDNNIALSRKRAGGSVRQTLIDRYGVPANQVAADGGVGFLSPPIASNQTEEGREANRRVEVILTTTQ